LEFDPAVMEDLAWWIQRDRKKAIRIMRPIQETGADPFGGIGKPEPLKHELAGCWSKRIDEEHRLVYQVSEKKVRILDCRYQYKWIGLRITPRIPFGVERRISPRRRRLRLGAPFQGLFFWSNGRPGAMPRAEARLPLWGVGKAGGSAVLSPGGASQREPGATPRGEGNPKPSSPEGAAQVRYHRCQPGKL
jgi:toxin YoeB